MTHTPDIEIQTTECPEHGLQQACFVCTHLAKSVINGDVVGYFCSEDEPDNPRPDAWCAACDKKRMECDPEGEWNDASEAFAEVTVVCGSCYDNLLAQNKRKPLA